MRTIHLPIQNPCHEDWDAMDAEGRRRFCHKCDKHVHDLTSMSEGEAKELLAGGCSSGERLCVRYAHDGAGNILFRSRSCVAPRPLSTMLRTAAAAIVLAACTPHERDKPRHVVGQIAAPPVQQLVEMGEIAVVDPPEEPCDPPIEDVKGEAPAPLMGAVAPPPAPKAVPELEEVMGKIARAPTPAPERVLMGDIAGPEDSGAYPSGTYSSQAVSINATASSKNAP